MNRRAFLKTGVGATGLFISPFAFCAETKQPAKVADSDILAQTGPRIEKHRKGDGTISVRDAKGRAVEGARIRVEQIRHEFLFGCNFFMFGRCGKPELEEAYRERFAALLNYCTLGFYWAGYEAERGKPHYEYTDAVVDWTSKHGITCKGHPLVWDNPASSPRWLPEDLKEVEKLSNARVHDVVSRFKGRTEIWDVVNEATHLTDKPNKTKMGELGVSLGARQYVAQHLKIARAANPKATLLVNDYRTDPAYYKILDGLREGNTRLFDVVGIQSHMHSGVWPMQKVVDICDTYSRLGAPLHFTETTIVSGPRKGRGENWGGTTSDGEEKQADRTVNFYATLFAHPAVQAITWWDFADYGAWQHAPAGWLRNDMSPKLVYERLMGLIKKQWWTKLEGVTNTKGEFKGEHFLGHIG